MVTSPDKDKKEVAEEVKETSSQSLFNALEARVTELESCVDTLDDDSRVNDLMKTVAELQTTSSTHTDQIRDLMKTVAERVTILEEFQTHIDQIWSRLRGLR